MASAEVVAPEAVRSSPELAADSNTGPDPDQADSLPSFTPVSGAGGATSISLESNKTNGAGVDEAEIA